MYNTKNQVMSFFFLCKMLRFLLETEIWNNVLSAGANNFADLSYLLIIQFTFFFVDDLVSNYGQHSFSRLTTICFPVVKVL